MNLGLDTLITSSAPFLIVLQIWRPRVLGWHWLCIPRSIRQTTPGRFYSRMWIRAAPSDRCFVPLWIYTALKLLPAHPFTPCAFVPLWIYTALKLHIGCRRCAGALYPSGFTQLSNDNFKVPDGLYALYPSGFTQLSNSRHVRKGAAGSFVPLWIYTALKRAGCGSAATRSFVPLWIYTALKLVYREGVFLASFVPLWIYTALKPQAARWLPSLALYPSGFTQLSNLKSEKPAQPAGVHPEGSPVHFYYSTSGGKGNPSGPYGGPCGGAGGACAAASCARSSHRSSSSSTRRSPGSRG